MLNWNHKDDSDESLSSLVLSWTSTCGILIVITIDSIIIIVVIIIIFTIIQFSIVAATALGSNSSGHLADDDLLNAHTMPLRCNTMPLPGNTMRTKCTQCPCFSMPLSWTAHSMQCTQCPLAICPVDHITSECIRWVILLHFNALPRINFVKCILKIEQCIQ